MFSSDDLLLFEICDYNQLCVAFCPHADTEEILTYEEVTRYYPQPNRKRPIVLVGPADVGRQELRERIMESDFERFAAAVPRE